MGKILFTTWGLFSTLGVYRGIKDYGFKYKQRVTKYEQDCEKYPNIYKNTDIYNYATKPKYYTSDAIATGCLGFVLYANPATCLIMLYNELHRLEINLRGYDDEKEKEEYHKLL